MALFLVASLNGNAAPALTLNPYDSKVDQATRNAIDDLVFAKLERDNVPPASVCSDGVFVRRAYLDIIGTLPSGYEAKEFILDRSANKRRVLVDRLLERDEFADYWAMKWSDLLRIKAEFPINLWPNAAQAYHRWVRTCIRDNVPYDQMVRQMLTSSGSNFRVAPVNFYRAMQNREPAGIAQTVALTFMGTRADKWPKDRLAGMAAFFTKVGYKSTAEWKEEIVFFDPGKTNAPATNEVTITAAVFPDGAASHLLPDQDPRAVFADWLIDPKNPWFTQNIANRVWAWLLGRGIIQEPDDFRPDNPPSNPELLALLERELITRHYDLKHLYRLILTSKTYQLSSIPKAVVPREILISRIIPCGGWMRRCWWTPSTRSPGERKIIPAPSPNRSLISRRITARLPCRMAALPVRSSRCSGARPATPDWSPNATTARTQSSGCTC